MSYDVTACMGLGWLVERDALTEKFWKNMDGDFGEQDGLAEPFGEEYAYELVMQVNEYSDMSPFFIGCFLDDMKRVGDSFERCGTDDILEQIGRLDGMDGQLTALYEGVMGEPPKDGARWHLLAHQW